MNKACLAAVLLVIGPVHAARAADAASIVQRAECPSRGEHDTDRAYSRRTRDYCETSWRWLVGDRLTSGQMHDDFANGCARRCAPRRDGLSGATLAAMLLGLGAAGGAAAAAGGRGSHPASP